MENKHINICGVPGCKTCGCPLDFWEKFADRWIKVRYPDENFLYKSEEQGFKGLESGCP